MINNQSVILSDGRSLGFQCLGDLDGSPVFFFHGTPGSRLGLSENDLLAQIPGVRLIIPDRPGYGISDPQPGRMLLDWPDDVVELADHLGFDSFAVGGASGGGPHALACAYRLAHRVTKSLLISSPSPAGFKGVTRGMALANKLALLLGQYAPWLVRQLIRSYASSFEKDPEGYLDAMVKQLPRPDQALLENVSLREEIIRDLREAYRQGPEAHVIDGALTMASQEWGFSLSKISIPVFLWHGEEDSLVSINMAKHLMHEIPRCTARIVPGAGHLLLEDPMVVGEIQAVLCKRAV